MELTIISYRCQFDQLDWAKAWLYISVADYYGLALCLSIICLHTEDVPYGLMWSLSFCTLGSPAACAYLIMRLVFKSVVLADKEPDIPPPILAPE